LDSRSQHLCNTKDGQRGGCAYYPVPDIVAASRTLRRGFGESRSFTEGERIEVLLGSRLLIVLTMVVLMVLAIGVVGAVSASPDDKKNKKKGHTTLTVVTKTPELKAIDLGPQGPTLGDIRVTNAPLYNATGTKRIGRFDLFCAITDPADEAAEEAHMAECTKTFTLPGGEISVQGVEAYPTLSAPAPGEDAITGGTGKYTGVRGEQRFEPRRTRVINTFHFID
jgi:allene oxide cyclase-like protein